MAFVAIKMGGDLESIRSVVEFCRFVRENGLDSGIKATIDSVRAVRIAGQGGFEDCRNALRAVLAASKTDWDLFDQLFDAFWFGYRLERRARPVTTGNSAVSARTKQGIYLDVGNPASKEPGATKEERKVVTGASAMDRLRKVDFSRVSQGDLAELGRLSERLLRRMSLRLSRRFRLTPLRGRIDLRRTLSAGAARGGEIMKLRYKNRKKQAARLVILLDVSDSMNPYSMFLFRFAYVLGKHFDQPTCFVFSTRLVNVSDVLKARSLPDALRALSTITTCWSGGTRIANALGEFNRSYGRRMRSSETSVIILSDGWDTDEPGTLVAELKTLKQHAKKLIWLNPLLGLDQYEPVTRSMSVALPYIDVFAPAHNLQSLLELERHV
jgi:uncharacterized protein with von Willebrand factor type A (vWA) domain